MFALITSCFNEFDAAAPDMEWAHFDANAAIATSAQINGELARAKKEADPHFQYITTISELDSRYTVAGNTSKAVRSKADAAIASAKKVTAALSEMRAAAALKVCQDDAVEMQATAEGSEEEPICTEVTTAVPRRSKKFLRGLTSVAKLVSAPLVMVRLARKTLPF